MRLPSALLRPGRGAENATGLLLSASVALLSALSLGYQLHHRRALTFTIDMGGTVTTLALTLAATATALAWGALSLAGTPSCSSYSSASSFSSSATHRNPLRAGARVLVALACAVASVASIFELQSQNAVVCRARPRSLAHLDLQPFHRAAQPDPVPRACTLVAVAPRLGLAAFVVYPAAIAAFVWQIGGSTSPRVSTSASASSS